MSGVKATLKVILHANDTVVAESEDPLLWQQILVSINTGATLTEDRKGVVPSTPETPRARVDVHSEQDTVDVEILRFATLIGVSSEELQGACAPSKTSPLLTLDMHCWNTMKEQTPAAGQGSISPMSIAATLLALWMQSSKLGSASQKEAQKVLGTINLRDANAGRSIQGTEWLQGRPGGVVVVNPARVKRAVAIARAFCSQNWKSDQTWKSGSAE